MTFALEIPCSIKNKSEVKMHFDNKTSTSIESYRTTQSLLSA